MHNYVKEANDFRARLEKNRKARGYKDGYEEVKNATRLYYCHACEAHIVSVPAESEIKTNPKYCPDCLRLGLILLHAIRAQHTSSSS